MKFYWRINSNFDKRFTEQKNYSANFLQWGEACAVPFTLLIVDACRRADSGEIAPVWRPVRVCMKTNASRISWKWPTVKNDI